MAKINMYKIPHTGPEREALREKGQFWTPDWIAEAMVEYLITNDNQTVFDPAVGAGAFFRASKRIAAEKGFQISLVGMDIDPYALDEARMYGLHQEDLSNVSIEDFLFQKPNKKFSAIVANPPYIRHHRISIEKKEQLSLLSINAIGKKLDGRAGLHIYFLIQSLLMLKDDGRLAFIMPADTCEGKFAQDLWQWITVNYCLDAVVTFAPEASPFPNIDTNPLIFLIRNSKPKDTFVWAKCYSNLPEYLKLWIRSGFSMKTEKSFSSDIRQLDEGLQTGFSRPKNIIKNKYILGDFISVVRGVATGANNFFFLTQEQVVRSGIPEKYFVRAIGRTRDISEQEITYATLDTLQKKGRPTFLLALNGDPFEQFPESLQLYLKIGESLGLPEKPLISQRKPWYKTEVRRIPPFLFAYLGRRSSRFIRNTAGIIPLTGFLCIYPQFEDENFYNFLWAIFSHPETMANLSLIGKSYGDGALKVEPRSLEKLSIPDNVIDQIGLPDSFVYMINQSERQPTQLRFLEQGIQYT